MKNQFVLCGILFGAIFFSSCGEDVSNPETDLSGSWIGEGYLCGGAVYSENIRIDHDTKTGKVVATKVTGDPCVPAGNVTFSGVYNGKDPSFAATYTIGTPINPVSGQSISMITVKNASLMESSVDVGVVYKKK